MRPRHLDDDKAWVYLLGIVALLALVGLGFAAVRFYGLIVLIVLVILRLLQGRSV